MKSGFSRAGAARLAVVGAAAICLAAGIAFSPAWSERAAEAAQARHQPPPGMNREPRPEWVPLETPQSPARTVVDRLDYERFKGYLKALSDMGDRRQGTESNLRALQWSEEQFRSFGLEPQQHHYRYRGEPRYSVYATKVGTRHPDQMYIISAHIDGIGGGGGANDNAAGCALVLEAARVFGMSDVETEYSIRFILWNNEETGLNGARAYVSDRRQLQGREDPPGSGQYPEPRWLGVIQHDQILWDHGLPVQEQQNPRAVSAVEYQQRSRYARHSMQLGAALMEANARYSSEYPTEVTSNMSHTDSVPFQNYTASISVRDNQRIAQIGRGSNPQWHRRSDVYETFGEEDFWFGFNVVQMTTGAVAELVNTVAPRP